MSDSTNDNPVLPCYARLIVAALLAVGLAGGANAAVVHGASAGSGANIDISGFLSLSTGPLPAGVSGTAPPAFSESAASVTLDESVSVSTGLLGTVQFAATGVLSAAAESDVDGSSGPKSASATGAVNDLDMGINDLSLLGLVQNRVMRLQADTLSSTSSVSGDAGAFSAEGSSTIENADLFLDSTEVLGLSADVGVALDANAEPNTEVLPDVLGPAGLSVILNEQGGSCGASACSQYTNAVHLAFDDFALSVGDLNGDIFLGSSEAELSAVPLPAAVWLFGGGLAGLIGLGVKHRRNEV